MYPTRKTKKVSPLAKAQKMYEDKRKEEEARRAAQQEQRKKQVRCTATVAADTGHAGGRESQATPTEDG